MLKDNLIKVKRKWHAERLKPAAPLSEEEVIRESADLGISIARDAVEVYSTISGFSEDGMDSECLTFWTIEKILRENDFNAEEVYFAGFLIDSRRYCFEYKNAESSAVCLHYSETDRHKIADSFDEFFELYLKNTNELFH